MNFLKQDIKKKENLKLNLLFTFFKVFLIFTRPDTASDKWVRATISEYKWVLGIFLEYLIVLLSTHCFFKAKHSRSIILEKFIRPNSTDTSALTPETQKQKQAKMKKLNVS